ncbi:Crp/Fnr family transcriptional regulator [Sphingomicrobium sp. XHP0239]|uniref:Crp/Fnr family transcriptional regulator n=1 Tax=Sphingomicrobium maritimum TaxID=3133972 RepID=UPI0031CC397A
MTISLLDTDVDLVQTLVGTGLAEPAARALAAIPSRIEQAHPKRPFREIGFTRNELMFVCTGILAKYRTDGNGRRQIVALRFPGEGILPANDRHSSVGLAAIVPSRVMVASAEDLDPILAAHPEIAQYFLKQVQRENSINYEWLLSCGRRDSLARVAHLLLEMARRMRVSAEEHGLLNPFTQQEVADITGQTSVNVNRMFAQLERDGLIRREGRRVFFERTEELRRLAGFEEAYLA